MVREGAADGSSAPLFESLGGPPATAKGASFNVSFSGQGGFAVAEATEAQVAAATRLQRFVRRKKDGAAWKALLKALPQLRAAYMDEAATRKENWRIEQMTIGKVPGEDGTGIDISILLNKIPEGKTRGLLRLLDEKSTKNRSKLCMRCP